MNRKSVIRVIIITLSTLTILTGLVLFHIEYGLWWDRPDLGNNIVKIEISEGGFVPPGVEYTSVVLTPDSKEFQNITDIIESGWSYHVALGGIKVSSYIVEITYSDGSLTKVDMAGKIIRVETTNDVQLYKSRRNLSEAIEKELNITK